MSEPIHFTIYGEPVAQGRPRAGKIQRGRLRGKTILYDPEESRDYKTYLKLAASQQAPEKPLEGPLQLVVHIYLSILQDGKHIGCFVIQPLNEKEDANERDCFY
ncbi:Endodeoxyribonuclease RusA [Aneurinibacillus thermoaerophilus]|uniref:Endodeoxyribonuclease RusA n=1 Tax=Aneurinibacillus thermoaerophilus TaxID=143495 RepID=A0A1G8ELZ2_ANETH|nr:RusA family crossover junction endodeoxyribonuclease [Aneurinibacillus thermoaerophilus]SDH70719.1 Endodeoxyribonuclease RusA [Aneurinibacillus thermoaerophilus]